MIEMLKKAKAAKASVSLLTTRQKNAALEAMADALLKNESAILAANEADLAAAGSITYGSNVKEVTTQVSEAAVDCGIIYSTDAFSAGLTVVDTATAEMCGQVIYPAAVMNVSKNADAAKAFLTYLTGDAADAVFEAVGFTPVA